MKTTIIDYGASNMLSVHRALQHCDADLEVVDSPARVIAADRLVLPGVGAFGHCMERLAALGLTDALTRYFATGRPVLGICVGMQVLFGTGAEFGEHRGLGWIPGRCERIFEPTAGGPSLPHIGWASLAPVDGGDWAGTVLETIAAERAVYFLHSFQGQCVDRRHLLAVTGYEGHEITAAVQRDAVIGFQFHPEKSGEVGLTILRRFLRM